MEKLLTVRACTRDDLATVLALARADEERVSGLPSRLVDGDVRDWWQTVDLAANSWLLFSPSRRLRSARPGWTCRTGASGSRSPSRPGRTSRPC